jgi:lysine-specific permease
VVIECVRIVRLPISHYRFRKAYLAQGLDLGKLPYKAKWFPFGPNKMQAKKTV